VVGGAGYGGEFSEGKLDAGTRGADDTKSKEGAGNIGSVGWSASVSQLLDGLVHRITGTASSICPCSGLTPESEAFSIQMPCIDPAVSMFWASVV
jgi:hypothetical protein